MDLSTMIQTSAYIQCPAIRSQFDLWENIVQVVSTEIEFGSFVHKLQEKLQEYQGVFFYHGLK